MTTLDTAVQGDVNEVRTVTISGVQDLTAATAVEAHVWLPGLAATTLNATITDTTARTVDVNLGDATGWLATVDVTGDYRLEVQITFSDGTILTWPSKSPDRLPVRAQGA